MSEFISAEGATLNEALQGAIEKLGASSVEELSWNFVKEHFRQGAWSVLLEAGLRTEEEIQAMRDVRRAADDAANWMREALSLFGVQARVRSRMVGQAVQVGILSPDASLLIGREGKNIQAFQLLLKEFVRRNTGNEEVRLDVDSPDQGERRPRREDRDSDGDGGRRGGRGRDGGGRGRDGGRRDGRGRRGERGARSKGDEERDEAIRVEAREAAERVLAGDDDSIQLSDMNSYERHVAHDAIKEIEGVHSKSVGEGRDKVVEVCISDS